MKKYTFLCAGFFLLGILSGPTHSFADAPNPEDLKIIKTVDGLKNADKQVGQLKTKIEKANKKIETDILNPITLSGLKSQIGMYQGELNAYKNDGMNDISYLQVRWKKLTQSQRDLIKQAQFDLTQ